MKILVTGHRGFIGQNMIAALKDHAVTTHEWGDPWPRLAGLDWVIHLGAISSTTERDVEKIMRRTLISAEIFWMLASNSGSTSSTHHRLLYTASAGISEKVHRPIPALPMPGASGCSNAIAVVV